MRDDQNFGLYLHVPYCRAVCHYCDFAKTANFDADHGARYVARLGEHLKGWLETLARYGEVPRFTSVFLGGGTPSLFAAEYAPLFEIIRPLLAEGAEVSLEANPDDVSAERLGIWRDLGVNRLSLGVQTFDPGGLAYLKRIHDAGAAKAAVEAACKRFESVSLDLIYGWGGPDGQPVESLAADLDQALALGISHLSLYTLTYEARTPIGRAVLRGLRAPAPDERLASMYDLARARLAAAGMVQQEVSNWARPGAACRHNWGYWQDQPYLGIGAGAHGYLKLGEPAGVRYAYPRADRAFLRSPVAPIAPITSMDDGDVLAFGRRFGVEVEDGRTADTWLTDYVGSALRTSAGLDLDRIRTVAGRELALTPLLGEAVDQGLIHIMKGPGGSHTLRLEPAEWFRETAWAVEILIALEASVRRQVTP